MYGFGKEKKEKISSLLRAIDTLFPISKTLAFSDVDIEVYNRVVCLPSSRFFRSYKKSEKIIQKIKMRRIKNEMTYAARNALHYHLWWHPHNFTDDVEKNLEQLEELLIHYDKLRVRYGFQSFSMRDFKI